MRYRWCVLLILLVFPITALAQTSPQLHWEQYDNTVEIQVDGSVQVQEQQVLVVDRGPARGMTRTFATGNAGRVSNIRAYEDGQLLQRRDGRDAGTYSGTDDGDQATIRVNFRDPNADRHTITIQYTIKQTLIAANDQAILSWRFFVQGSGMPEIRSGSVVLRFPDTVNTSRLNLKTSGVPVRQSSTSTSVRWELTQPIQGQELAVQAAFPRTLLGASAQFRQSQSQSAPAPNAPSNQAPAPGGAVGSGISDVVFCLFILLFLLIVFTIIRASARARRMHGYPTVPPVYDQSLGTPYNRRGWRRRRHGGGWGGGFGFPPVIITPPITPPQEYRSPLDNTPFDSGSGGGSSSWGDSGGGSSSWGDSGGGSSSWGDSGGGGSSWGDSGGGGSSWGDSGGGGSSNSGGSGSASFD